MEDLLALNIAEAANQGRVMELVHPKHRTPLIAPDGKPVSITLLGKDSDTYIAADREAKARNYENIAEGAKLSPAELDHAFSKTLAKCTTAWHGIPQDWIDNSKSAEPAKLTFDNAVKLYENPGVKWIREQADRFVGDRARFLGD